MSDTMRQRWQNAAAEARRQGDKVEYLERTVAHLLRTVVALKERIAQHELANGEAIS